ncbi:MAG: hypothetical protein QHJ82_17510 [Verrucomicrobiota bacterium]|nr:hypothetical protein [Verrucomicrobiota bacterium]
MRITSGKEERADLDLDAEFLEKLAFERLSWFFARFAFAARELPKPCEFGRM